MIFLYYFFFFFFFFFFNDTATTEIYTLSLHDALPSSSSSPIRRRSCRAASSGRRRCASGSTRTVRRTPSRWTGPSTTTAGCRRSRHPAAPARRRPGRPPPRRSAPRPRRTQRRGSTPRDPLSSRRSRALEGMTDLLADLNDAQREAVLHGDGPLLVLAGAGSGKTRVIVHRIARLVAEEGIVPWRILAVTFTNKAAGEMRERLEALLGATAVELWVQTFHAFGARFLRREAARAGLSQSFPIYDDDDQLRLVKGILAELGADDGETLTARQALSRIDQWKGLALRPAETRPGEYDVEGQLAREVYRRYEAALARAGAADFGDLLLRPVRLLEEDETLRARWAGRFEYLLVDEFQDTNAVQYRLLKLLAGSRGNVCVVGDDDQAIYRWRGANVENILGFDADFPGTRVVKLER